MLFFRGLFGGVCGLGIAFVEWRLGRFEARRLLSPLAPLVVCLAAFAISAYVAALMTTTVADVLVGTVLGFTSRAGFGDELPPKLKDYVARLTERPAYKRAVARTST